MLPPPGNVKSGLRRPRHDAAAAPAQVVHEQPEVPERFVSRLTTVVAEVDLLRDAHQAEEAVHLVEVPVRGASTGALRVVRDELWKR